MVRSIGVDPGDQAVKVVELEGSYRKTRLLRVHCVPVASAEAGARAEAVAAASRAALDEGMKGEVTLGHPLRDAVLRVIELPFKGRDAIRKVVKAEIEGEIHSHSVDDMIVDFHEIGEGAEGGTRVMVASVPKLGLRTQLAALTGQSIEVPEQQVSLRLPRDYRARRVMTFDETGAARTRALTAANTRLAVGDNLSIVEIAR